MPSTRTLEGAVRKPIFATWVQSSSRSTRCVPFGGTGHSGMGAYHGEWGFREFTHPSTVLKGKRRFNLSLREHPYDGDRLLPVLRLFEK